MHHDSLPLVGVIMGSKNDWETMQHCSSMLNELGVAHECHAISAHRQPARQVAAARGQPGGAADADNIHRQSAVVGFAIAELPAGVVAPAANRAA